MAHHITEACHLLNTISRTDRTKVSNISTSSSPKSILKKILTSASVGESVNYANKVNRMLAEDQAFQTMDVEMRKDGFQLKENEKLLRSSFVNEDDGLNGNVIVSASSLISRKCELKFPNTDSMRQLISDTSHFQDFSFGSCVSVQIRKEVGNVAVMVFPIASKIGTNEIKSIQLSESIPSDIITTIEHVRIVKRGKKRSHGENENEFVRNKKFSSSSSFSSPAPSSLSKFCSPSGFSHLQPLSEVHTAPLTSNTPVSGRASMTSAVYKLLSSQTWASTAASTNDDVPSEVQSGEKMENFLDIVLRVESKETDFCISKVSGSFSRNNEEAEVGDLNAQHDHLLHNSSPEQRPPSKELPTLCKKHMVGVRVVIPPENEENKTKQNTKLEIRLLL